jgi:predicted aldo/keto reductase-like oxidoreductase
MDRAATTTKGGICGYGIHVSHFGESEIAVRKALQDGYRRSVSGGQMPIWFAKNQEDMKAIFEEQFRRLNVDVIDFYLVHKITVPIWKRAKKYGLMEFLEEEKKKGRIRYTLDFPFMMRWSFLRMC